MYVGGMGGVWVVVVEVFGGGGVAMGLVLDINVGFLQSSDLSDSMQQYEAQLAKQTPETFLFVTNVLHSAH